MEATSALIIFHVGRLSQSYWRMLFFVEGENRKTRRKPLEEGKNQQQAQTPYGTEPESNRATLV